MKFLEYRIKKKLVKKMYEAYCLGHSRASRGLELEEYSEFKKLVEKGMNK